MCRRRHFCGLEERQVREFEHVDVKCNEPGRVAGAGKRKLEEQWVEESEDCCCYGGEKCIKRRGGE